MLDKLLSCKTALGVMFLDCVFLECRLHISQILIPGACCGLPNELIWKELDQIMWLKLIRAYYISPTLGHHDFTIP